MGLLIALSLCTTTGRKHSCRLIPLKKERRKKSPGNEFSRKEEHFRARSAEGKKRAKDDAAATKLQWQWVN
jgi:hypothetical protein